MLNFKNNDAYGLFHVNSNIGIIWYIFCQNVYYFNNLLLLILVMKTRIRTISQSKLSGVSQSKLSTITKQNSQLSQSKKQGRSQISLARSKSSMNSRYLPNSCNRDKQQFVDPDFLEMRK